LQIPGRKGRKNVKPAAVMPDAVEKLGRRQKVKLLEGMMDETFYLVQPLSDAIHHFTSRNLYLLLQ
jgi:hypothetical protein